MTTHHKPIHPKPLTAAIRQALGAAGTVGLMTGLLGNPAQAFDAVFELSSLDGG